MYQVPIYLPILIFSASVCHSLISFLHYRHTVWILFTDTAYAKAVESTVVSRAHIAAIEVHAVRVIIVVLCRRPIVAPHTGILQLPGRTATTDSGKLQLIGTVRFVGERNITII